MIELPIFIPSKAERNWIANHRETARHLKNLWRAASRTQRRNPEFLSLLLRATWVGSHHRSDHTRQTRNRYFSHWLGLKARSSDEELAEALSKRLSGLSLGASLDFVRAITGMTLYYSAARPSTDRLVRSHTAVIAKAFEFVARNRRNADEKVHEVAGLLSSLPRIPMPAGGTMSPFSGITPALAALDPQQRFPIINQQTRVLLSALGVPEDAEGAVAMARLIGRRNIEDNASLDVFANSRIDAIKGAISRTARRTPLQPIAPGKLTLLGDKSETKGIAYLSKRRVSVQRQHNQLTNRFRRAILWRHHPEQSRCDIVLREWKGNRWLLIEAKTATDGPGGRTQLRQAIGQLFDYRSIQFGGNEAAVDLALLTPTRPGEDVLRLLKSLRIESLWFSGDRLDGTIDLIA